MTHLGAACPASHRFLAACALLAASPACYRSEGDSPPPSFTVPLAPAAPVRVDMVVMVDNSGSMSQEQRALAASVHLLLEDLLDPPDTDGDGTPDHPPVEDLRVGVISSDMGSGGYRLSTCSNSDVGDNGCFLRDPPGAPAGCPSTLPLFLSRDGANAATYPPADLARDFGCLGALGTSGCGLEQQLEAMRHAVTDDMAPGGCNFGFLRPDSVLVLIWITDEEDCSVSPDHLEMFDTSRADLGHLGLRCFLHPDFLVPVADLVASLRAVRSDRPRDLVVGVIAGVPLDEPLCVGTGDAIARCLASPGMQETIDPTDPVYVLPSCHTAMGIASPPRRIVQVAQAFGASAYVDSICKEDWSTAMAGIGGRIADRLRHPCLDRELPFDPTSCATRCLAVETLPDDRPCEEDPSCPSAGCPPASPRDLPALSPCRHPSSGELCDPLKRDLGLGATPAGRMVRRCLVRQASRTPTGDRCSAPATSGWFYVPPLHSAAVPPCPEAFFVRGAARLFDPGSTAELRCFD
ncbi:MAG: hypothetical protein HY905_26565 [Deltaproteobacteria bacterium]|nr:hypothetical protein [Deltaproteobacteria bacterium]